MADLMGPSMACKSGKFPARPASKGSSSRRDKLLRSKRAARANSARGYSSSPRRTPSRRDRWTYSDKSTPGPDSKAPPWSKNIRASVVSCWRMAISRGEAEASRASADSPPLVVRVKLARRRRIWSNSSRVPACSKPPKPRGMPLGWPWLSGRSELIISKPKLDLGDFETFGTNYCRPPANT